LPIAHDDLSHLLHEKQAVAADKLIADKDRQVTFTNLDALKRLAHYRPQELTPVPQAMAPA
jgi:hypothetical protein